MYTEGREGDFPTIILKKGQDLAAPFWPHHPWSPQSCKNLVPPSPVGSPFIGSSSLCHQSLMWDTKLFIPVPRKCPFTVPNHTVVNQRLTHDSPCLPLSPWCFQHALGRLSWVSCSSGSGLKPRPVHPCLPNTLLLNCMPDPWHFKGRFCGILSENRVKNTTPFQSLFEGARNSCSEDTMFGLFRKHWRGYIKTKF